MLPDWMETSDELPTTVSNGAEVEFRHKQRTRIDLHRRSRKVRLGAQTLWPSSLRSRFFTRRKALKVLGSNVHSLPSRASADGSPDQPRTTRWLMALSPDSDDVVVKIKGGNPRTVFVLGTSMIPDQFIVINASRAGRTACFVGTTAGATRSATG